MASADIRKLLESFAQISEGYSDRVDSAAAAINREYPGGATTKEIQAALANSNNIEMKGSDKARNDFIKDVMGKVKRRRDNSAQIANGAAQRAASEAAMAKLDMIISDAVGNSFPDGDPWDHIAPKARRLGIPEDDLIRWLDRWAKKEAGSKSWHDYLAQTWDDYASGDYGIEGNNQRNPWR